MLADLLQNAAEGEVQKANCCKPTRCRSLQFGTVLQRTRRRTIHVGLGPLQNYTFWYSSATDPLQNYTFWYSSATVPLRNHAFRFGFATDLLQTDRLQKLARRRVLQPTSWRTLPFRRILQSAFRRAFGKFQSCGVLRRAKFYSKACLASKTHTKIMKNAIHI